MKFNPLGVSKMLKTGLELASEYAKNNMPKLLTMGSVACLGGAVYYTGKGTVQAVRLIDKKTLEKGAPLTTGEKVKEAWPCYIPAAAATLGSAGCAIGATHVLLTQNTALMAALAASEAKNHGLLEKAEELLSDGEADIPKEAPEPAVSSSPADPNSVISTGNGNEKFKDAITGREFYSRREFITQKAVRISNAVVTDGSQTMNDLYFELGIGSCDAGETYGFNQSCWPVTPHYSIESGRFGEPVTVVDFGAIVLPSST